MATKEEILSVIEENKINQRRAREVNLRAGETIFPVYTEQELTRLLASKLNGAKSIEETKQPWNLRLPSLDEEIIKMVFADNPDSISIPNLGHYRLVYEVKRFPRINLTSDWVKLKMDEIRLPGGRRVAVLVKFDDGAVFGPRTDLAKLKSECVEYFTYRAFQNWTPPKLPVPDIGEIDQDSLMLNEQKFGKHPLGKERLIAYGALALEKNRVTWKWFLKKDEAENELFATFAKISEMEESIS